MGILNLFKKKTTPVIGLDVSSSSIKLLELSKQGSGYRVENYAVRDLPVNAVVEKNINDADAVAQTLRSLISSSKIKLKDVALAVSGASVITKVIDMSDELTADDMEAQIAIEADQYIPFPLEEVALDFDVIGPSQNGANRVDVLITACRRENVEIRESIVQMAELTPKIIDVEAYTVERAFGLMKDRFADADDQVVAIIDIGATMTTLNILVDGKTVYTREQLFGGKQLTEEIQRRYGLSAEEAIRAKKEGGLPDDYETEVLEPFKDSVVQQITRSLQFFFSSTQYDDVDFIMLAGGVANLDDLSRVVEEKLGTPAMVANPFADMSTSGRVNDEMLSEHASSLIVAAGLALRSFE